MIVCLCHRVSESQIAGHVRSGCSSFEDLQDELRVATACGACLDCARSTFDSARGRCAGACGGLPLAPPAALLRQRAPQAPGPQAV